MTVKETLDFSARCQGIGPRYGKLHLTILTTEINYNVNCNCNLASILLESNLKQFTKDLLTELARREMAAGIFPEPDIDLFMKVCTTVHNNNSCHLYISSCFSFTPTILHEKNLRQLQQQELRAPYKQITSSKYVLWCIHHYI